ncbi:MAG: hypothetical protein ABH808_02230 [Candidatus Kuenenbacteria bacterium]
MNEIITQNKWPEAKKKYEIIIKEFLPWIEEINIDKEKKEKMKKDFFSWCDKIYSDYTPTTEEQKQYGDYIFQQNPEDGKAQRYTNVSKDVIERAKQEFEKGNGINVGFNLAKGFGYDFSSREITNIQELNKLFENRNVSIIAMRVVEYK